MASAVQQTVFRRKVVYVVAILVILVVNTFFWRGVASPLTGGQPLPWTVTAQATKLELNELATGEADLTGSAVRLLLTGSRGLALATLWYQSDEKKKRHEWNKLEMIVDSITRLQPHTSAPWLFQSWNIAYNVSVDSDRVRDKYFYIARGMELLAKGVRLNRDNPDLRYMMGFYYQNKFGVSDEVNVLRSLLQMSCIDPRERDAGKLRPGDRVDSAKFEEFVQKNPQLVRRLRDKLNKGPEEIVDFLKDSRGIPCRFFDPSLDQGHGLKPAHTQFPVLPLELPVTNRDLVKFQDSELRDDFDNYQAGESWFSFAMDPLPEADPSSGLIDRRERARRTLKRVPRQPAEVIFRHGPARAQSFVGERLAKEGWFDESGWVIDENRIGADRWFEKDVVVGSGVPWARDAWSKAARLWRQYGEANGLYYEATELARLEELAKPYQDRYQVSGGIGRDVMDENVDPGLKESFRAYRKLFFYNQNKNLTNFAHHYFRAYAEMDPVTIRARQLFFEADRFRALHEPDRAIATYEKAFDEWTKVLTRYVDFRQDTSIAEDMYEIQVHYMDLIDNRHGLYLRPVLTVTGLLEEGLAATAGVPITVAPVGGLQLIVRIPKQLPLPVVGPMDRKDPQGVPWIDPGLARGVRVRMGREVDPPPEPSAEPQMPPRRRGG